MQLGQVRVFRSLNRDLRQQCAAPLPYQKESFLTFNFGWEMINQMNISSSLFFRIVICMMTEGQNNIFVPAMVVSWKFLNSRNLAVKLWVSYNLKIDQEYLQLFASDYMWFFLSFKETKQKTKNQYCLFEQENAKHANKNGHKKIVANNSKYVETFTNKEQKYIQSKDLL